LSRFVRDNGFEHIDLTLPITPSLVSGKWTIDDVSRQHQEAHGALWAIDGAVLDACIAVPQSLSAEEFFSRTEQLQKRGLEEKHSFIDGIREELLRHPERFRAMFGTAAGTTYFIGEDGSVLRIRAPESEPSPAKRIPPPSEILLFVGSDDAERLAIMSHKRDGPRLMCAAPVQTVPFEIGVHPFDVQHGEVRETSDGKAHIRRGSGAHAHVGNRIVSISKGPDQD
jgi:hypothetical protein